MMHSVAVSYLGSSIWRLPPGVMRTRKVIALRIRTLWSHLLGCYEAQVSARIRGAKKSPRRHEYRFQRSRPQQWGSVAN